jgi:hypothetical protein
VLLTVRGINLPGTRFERFSGVRVGLRVGGEFADITSGGADQACWQTEIRVRQLAESYDYTGPAVRGRRGERCLGLGWLDETGEMFRALKIRLDQLPADLVSDPAAEQNGLLATVRLTDEHGGPLCASAPKSHLTWTLGTGR